MRSRQGLLTLVALGATLIFAPAVHAVPIVLQDTYQGQHASGGGPASQAADVIGTYSDFDVDSITITQLDPGHVTMAVRFNFHSGESTLADWVDFGATMRVGDVLMSANGHQYGVALVNHDGYHAGDLYSITGTQTSNDYLGAFSGRLYWRFNTPVRMNPNPTAGQDLGAGTSTTSNIGGNEVQAVLSFNTGGAFWLDYVTSGVVSMSFASAICANDIVTGNVPYTPVPEPASLGLAGVGLLMVSLVPRVLRRRRVPRTDER